MYCGDIVNNKVMEAPEKIYIIKYNDYSDREIMNAFTKKEQVDDIEYTRTEAFIEKAKEFLLKESNIPLWDDRGGNFGCDTPKLVENFIKYMKGE